jgi:hypothetical protein
MLLPHINNQFRIGAPASTSLLAEIWAVWHAGTEVADLWLDTLSARDLVEPRQILQIEPRQVTPDGEPIACTFGSLLQRVLYY